MDLRTAVENFLSTDVVVQKQAEQTLSTLISSQFESSVIQLSEIVKAQDATDILRQSAALAFKNAISSKDDTVKLQREAAWLNVAVAARNYVKQNILEALRTDQVALGRSVAQCVAHIALVEVVRGEWQDIIPYLTSNVSSPESSSVFKQSCLETIGYICEEVSIQSVEQYSNDILTAIVYGMRKDELSTDIRLAATNALHNSMDFFKGNFAKEDERNYIMTIVCEATQAEDNRLKTAALQCISQIIQLYYRFMEPYVATGLLPISCRAMSDPDSDEVVLQGIEFWSTLCDEEIRLQYEKSAGSTSSGECLGFVSKHFTAAIPSLLQWLTRQPDHDEEEWIPSKAATVSLILIAECVEDEVVPPVVPFVVQNIQSSDWHCRDAACVAFGAILEGPNPNQLKPIVDEAYDHILRMMSDDNMAVRDSAAWVIQRMCEFLARTDNVPAKRIYDTLTILRQNLTGASRVAANVCWAIGALAKASYVPSTGENGDVRPSNTALSPIFGELLEECIKAGHRADAMDNNLRTAAFEAVIQLVKYSPMDCYTTVQKIAMLLFNYINGGLEKGAVMSSDERARYADFCQHWFSVLEAILHRLVPEDLKNVRGNVFTVCLLTLDLHRSGHSYQAEPEALMSLLTIMLLEPKDFAGNLDVLHPYIVNALNCFSEHAIINGALSLVSEICRTYETSVLRFVPNYVDLITALISQVNDPSGLVKPRAICSLGDIALSMGPHFFPFAVKSFDTLRGIVVPTDADVWMSVLDAILEACVGLIQCLLACDRQDDGRTMIRVYASFIVPLITRAAVDLADISDHCISNCALLMNFLCITFGREMLPVIDRPEFHALLTRGKKLKGTNTRSICAQTMKELKRLKDNTGTSEVVAR